MNKFKIGDRVRMLSRDDRVPLGNYGTVASTGAAPYVCWDGFTFGHAGPLSDGNTSHWCVSPRHLQLVTQEHAPPAATASALPTDSEARNAIPMADGLLYYFPNALAEVARISKIGNEQHNAGEPMHWARNKSTDHANKIIRHQMESGTFDADGSRHSGKVAWRALAQLEDELIAAGATPGRNTKGTPVLLTEAQRYDLESRN